MHFIELTRWGGVKFLVNMEHVIRIDPDSPEDAIDGTTVYFVMGPEDETEHGHDDRYQVVKETPEEIMELCRQIPLNLPRA